MESKWKDILVMQTIKEWHVDLLLLMLIHGSKTFRSFLVARLKIPANPDHDFITASHSVRDWENRESDLEVFFKLKNGNKFAILIEDKIDAQFSGDQDKRYRRRIEEGVQSGLWTKAITCLIAPDSYLSGTTDSDWDYRLPIEDVVSWLKTHKDEDPYLSCFVHILETAVKKKDSIQAVKEISDQVTLFFKSYYTHCEKLYPEASMFPRTENRTLNSYNWPWFGYKSVPSNQGIQIYHKTVSSKGSWVEMRIMYCAAEHFIETVKKSPHYKKLKEDIPDIIIEQRKQSKKAPSVYLKVKVNPVDIRVGFKEQVADIDDALKKAVAIVRFYKNERVAVDKMINSAL